MRYAYYPGCSLQSTSREYDISLRAVCARLGIELTEVEDWLCCGALPGHAAPRRLGVALASHNLAQAQRQGLPQILAPCAGCYSRLKHAWLDLCRMPELRFDVERALGHQFEDEIGIFHPLEVLPDHLKHYDTDKIASQSLSELRVVCYYGCLITHAGETQSDEDPEHPQGMSRLMEAVGVTNLEWGYSTVCCGGSLSLTRADVALKLTADILAQAREMGAQAIVVACPLCQLNLDSRQKEIERLYGVRYSIPVVYFTQILGLALGIPGRQLMLQKHFVDASYLIERVVTK
jgi:heterodisulfide reductase subunit B2